MSTVRGLVIEPTSRRDTFLAQEALKARVASKLVVYSIVAGATVQGGVGSTGDVFNTPIFESTSATPSPLYGTTSGPVNIWKSAGFADDGTGIQWNGASSDEDQPDNYLNGEYQATFTTERPDPYYQVQITISYPYETTQGYTIIPRVTEKTTEGFKYQLFYAPDGSTPSTADVSTIFAPKTDGGSDELQTVLAVSKIPKTDGGLEGSIPVTAVQFSHSIIVIDIDDDEEEA